MSTASCPRASALFLSRAHHEARAKQGLVFAGPDRMQWLLLVPPVHKCQQFYGHKNLCQFFIWIYYYSSQVIFYFFCTEEFPWDHQLAAQEAIHLHPEIQTRAARQMQGRMVAQSCAMISVPDFGNGQWFVGKVGKKIILTCRESKGLFYWYIQPIYFGLGEKLREEVSAAGE